MSDEGRILLVVDRDGTLLDFTEAFLAFITHLHRAESVELPSQEEILSLDYWRRIEHNELLIGSVNVRSRIDEVVTRHVPASGKLYPGVADALRELARRGIKIALVSGWIGTTQTIGLLERLDIIDAVEIIRTRDDLPPDAAAVTDLDAKIYLAQEALAALGRRPNDVVLVVGDTPADIETGHALGAYTIAVATGNGRRLATEIERLRPHRCLPSFADLPTYINEIRQMAGASTE